MFQIITVIAGILLIAADQLSKAWAVSVLQPIGSIEAIPGLLNFTFLPNGNNGAAWNILAGKQTLLIALTALLLLALLYLLVARKITNRLGFFSLVIIMAGGIGNLIDRISQHYVVDFIQFAFWKSFPIFNIADICVTVGVALFCIYILFFEGKEEKSL